MVDPIQIPEDKFDTTNTLERLNNLPISQWRHHIPALLTWLQDPHWPIFVPVRDLLLKNPDGCVEPLIEIYDVWNDTEWHWHTLNMLVPLMPLQCQYRLEPALRRLRHKPACDEGFIDVKEYVDESIDEMLAKWERDRQ